jgi:predicted enzyme related to lactoylglutathione lyase
MGERSEYTPGTFSWVDLSTTDVDGAKGFYSGLFGWEVEDRSGEWGSYTTARKDGKVVAGLSAQREDEAAMGIPTHWNSYVTVPSAEAVIGRVQENGGGVLAEPFDVLEEGRMAIVADPTGAVLSLWQAGNQHGAELVNAPGTFTWNELATHEPETAGEFWSGVFGWELEKVPGPVDYWIIKNQGRSNGGIRRMGDEMPPDARAHWLVYFGSDDAAATQQRGADLGGRVVVPRMEVPMGAFAVLTDPQGGAFAVFEGNFDD